MRLLLILFVLTLSLNTFAIELKDFDSKVAHQLVEKEGALLLDVRTLFEYKIKSLKNSKRIHIGDLEENLSQVKKWNSESFDKPIVVFCASGVRSAKAKKILIKNGFKKVINLGGIGNW